MLGLFALLATVGVSAASLSKEAPPPSLTAARVYVERLALDSPFWYAPDVHATADGHAVAMRAKTHGYSVAIFELDFAEPLSLTRSASSSAPGAFSSSSHAAATGGDDSALWSALGDDWRSSPVGLLRLTCPGQSFESFPHFSSRPLVNTTASSSSAARAAADVPDAADELGPPVFLTPLPSSPADTWSAQPPSPAALARRADHRVYHLLRSLPPPPLPHAGTGGRLRAALLLHHSQPRARARGPGAWRQPRSPTHSHGHVDVLPAAALTGCELHVLPPGRQTVRPPTAAATAAATEGEQGVVRFSAAAGARPCADRALCIEVAGPAAAAKPSPVAAAAAPTEASAAPATEAAEAAAASSALASGAAFLAGQGHLDHIPAPGEAPALGKGEGSSEGESAADALAVLRVMHPEHRAAYRLAGAPAASLPAHAAHSPPPSSSAATAVDPDAPRLEPPVQCAFDSDSDPVFLTLSSSMMVQAHVRGLVEGAMQPFQPMIGGVFSGALGGHLSSALGATVVPAVAEIVVRDLSRIVPPHLKQVMPSSIAEIVKAQLPVRATVATSRYVTWVLANKLVDDFMLRAMPVVSEDVIRRVSEVTPPLAAAMTTTRLAHGLTRALTHSIVPALTKTLEYSPLRSSWCEACREYGKLCQFCWQSPENMQAGLYYAGYYSTWYGDYYTRYFVGHLAQLQREGAERELEAERLRGRYDVLPDVEPPLARR